MDLWSLGERKSQSGGDSSVVQDQLQGVKHIQACFGTFAAILGDGCVVTWGRFGDSSAVRDRLRDVQKIQASLKAYAAILGDESVVTWGGVFHGGDSSWVQDQLRRAANVF